MKCALLLLVALAAAPAPAEHTALPGTAASFDVRVTRGRGRLVQGQEIRTLRAAGEVARGRGEGAFGLGTGAVGELAWRSLASLRLEGPAEIEWSSQAGNGDLQLVVGAAAALDLEARRSGVRLELSHGWRLEVVEAAVQLSEDPRGGWWVRHHGGRAVQVRSRVPREERGWPRVVRPGERVRLAPRRVR